MNFFVGIYSAIESSIRHIGFDERLEHPEFEWLRQVVLSVINNEGIHFTSLSAPKWQGRRLCQLWALAI